MNSINKQKNDQISQIVLLNDLVHTNKLKLKMLTLHKVMLLAHIINTRSTILRKEWLRTTSANRDFYKQGFLTLVDINSRTSSVNAIPGLRSIFPWWQRDIHPPLLKAKFSSIFNAKCSKNQEKTTNKVTVNHVQQSGIRVTWRSETQSQAFSPFPLVWCQRWRAFSGG